MRVRGACALYKLVQGALLLICPELFAVGQSTVSVCLRDVVNAVNVGFRLEISFPRGNRLLNMMNDFHDSMDSLLSSAPLTGLTYTFASRMWVPRTTFISKVLVIRFKSKPLLIVGSTFSTLLSVCWEALTTRKFSAGPLYTSKPSLAPYSRKGSM
jgi:hypothetical protein